MCICLCFCKYVCASVFTARNCILGTQILHCLKTYKKLFNIEIK